MGKAKDNILKTIEEIEQNSNALEKQLFYYTDKLELHDMPRYLEYQFDGIWAQLSTKETDEIYNQYLTNTNSLFLKMLLLNNKLPEDDETLRKCINDILDKSPNALWYIFTMQNSYEERKRILSVEPNTISRIWNGCDDFIFRRTEVFDLIQAIEDELDLDRIEELLEQIPNPNEEVWNDKYDEQDYMEDAAEMSEEEYYEIYGDDDENDMSYEEYLERTRPPYDLYLTRKQIIQTVICERISALETEKLTIDLIQYVIKNCYDENILNQLFKNMPKSQEVFDFFEQYIGREEAITYVNPNLVSIEEVENVLEKLKNTSREGFERILLNLDKQSQTEKMYNMFAEIAELTVDPTGYRCLANISPDICTPELWEKFYTRADRIWVCVPEELQTEEMFELALKHEWRTDEIWKHTKLKTADRCEKIIKKLKESYKEEIDIDILNALLQATDTNDLEIIKPIIFASTENSEEGQKRLDIYQKLIKYNPNINSTLNIELLDSKFDFLELEDRSRITVHKEIQKKISWRSKDEYFLNILKTIVNESENIPASIAIFYDTTENHGTRGFGTLYTDSEVKQAILEDKSEELAKKLIKLCINNEENYFEIDTLEKLKKYEEIRKNTCLKIINNEATDFERINQMPELERKKFAILELLYGVDYREALNISQKYGIDINNIEENENNKPIKEFINNINSILYLDDQNIEALLQSKEFREILENSEARDLGLITNIENACIKMYTQEYEKTIFKPDSDFANSLEHFTINYQGEEIEAIDLSPGFDENGNLIKSVEFTILGRVEGAYTDWTPPKNYLEYINQIDVNHHGNCESIVTNDFIAFARPKGPTLGYTDTSRYGNSSSLGYIIKCSKL